MHAGLHCEYFQYEQRTIISVSPEKKVPCLISRAKCCSWSHPDNFRIWLHEHNIWREQGWSLREGKQGAEGDHRFSRAGTRTGWPIGKCQDQAQGWE